MPQVVLTAKNHQGRKIQWIKDFREATGWNLKASKDLADQLNFALEEFTSKNIYIDIPPTTHIKLLQVGCISSSKTIDTMMEVKAALKKALECAVRIEEYSVAENIIHILKEFNNEPTTNLHNY